MTDQLCHQGTLSFKVKVLVMVSDLLLTLQSARRISAGETHAVAWTSAPEEEELSWKLQRHTKRRCGTESHLLFFLLSFLN